MSHYILTTNTKKLVKVTLEKHSEWISGRDWNSKDRVIAQDTIGDKLITTILQEDSANTPIKPKKLFITYVDDGDKITDETEIRHSATIKQAQNYHKRVVVKEQSKN